MVLLITWTLLWPACACRSGLSAFPLQGNVGHVAPRAHGQYLDIFLAAAEPEKLFGALQSRLIFSHECLQMFLDMQNQRLPAAIDHLSSVKLEVAALAEEQAFPLVAVHFLLQLKLVMTLELACLRSFLSTPIFIIIFNLYDHCISSLCLSAAFCPSAQKVARKAEQRMWPSLAHCPWAQGELTPGGVILKLWCS